MTILLPFHALVTSGPTRERIDPVRYLSNFSSGKQGHAIAASLAKAGVKVTLVSGPVALPRPEGVNYIPVESAEEMLQACEAALPADIAIFAAAVCDWRVASIAGQKMKKKEGVLTQTLELVQNPDILYSISHHPQRPKLVIGFAAETENLISEAQAKRNRKGCDWILANDVGAHPEILGGDSNTIHLLTAQGEESWPSLTKTKVAERLVERILQVVNKTQSQLG